MSRLPGLWDDRSMEGNHWFADQNTDEDDDYLPDFPWQPFLQMEGCIARLDVWFATEEQCVRFIESEIVGAGADLTVRTR